jgi:ABC-type glycerol-3-phosphate transport system permease component
MKKGELCKILGAILSVFSALSTVILFFFGCLILADSLPFQLIFKNNTQDRMAKGWGVMIAAVIYAVLCAVGIVLIFTGRWLARRQRLN